MGIPGGCMVSTASAASTQQQPQQAECSKRSTASRAIKGKQIKQRAGSQAQTAKPSKQSTCTFRHLKVLVPHPRNIHVPSDTWRTWKWSPTPTKIFQILTNIELDIDKYYKILQQNIFCSKRHVQMLKNVL